MCQPDVGGGKYCSRLDYVVPFYGNALKNPPEKESFSGKAYFHCIPLNVEVLAVFQCDCTVLTAPENNTGFRGETGTKIFTCFLG